MPVTTGAMHGRNTRLIMAGYSFSCAFREASVALSNDTVDVTAFCNGVRSTIVGLPEARVSLNGFLDAGVGQATAATGAAATDGANFAVIQPYYVAGTSVPFVIMPQGFAAAGLALGGSGIITSMNLGQSVADVQSLSMEVMVTGELYVMRNLYAWNSAIARAATTANQVIGVQTPGQAASAATDRTTVLEAPYIADPYAGLLYYQIRNHLTAPQSFNWWSTDAVVTNGTLPTAGGTATLHGSATVAEAGVGAGVLGTAASPLSIKRHVSTWITSAGAVTDRFYPYLGLVDTQLSLLNR